MQRTRRPSGRAIMPRRSVMTGSPSAGPDNSCRKRGTRNRRS